MRHEPYCVAPGCESDHEPFTCLEYALEHADARQYSELERLIQSQTMSDYEDFECGQIPMSTQELQRLGNDLLFV